MPTRSDHAKGSQVSSEETSSEALQEGREQECSWYEMVRLVRERRVARRLRRRGQSLS